ncbi:hypothetical protein [Ruegeria sp.]|uniref:hypothetical protein n=1 Tax=Ruegeria sp. TaxID=1879320 RepID=UPI003B009FA3
MTAQCTCPARARRARRGLGLVDTMLAVALLCVLALWGSQATTRWVDDRVMTGEVRMLAGVAQAARRLVEEDVSHAIRSAPVDTLQPVTFRTLIDADLWSRAANTATPARRQIDIRLLRQANDRVLVLVRARAQTHRPDRVPFAATGVPGVGVLLDDETDLKGPGLAFDFAHVTLPPGYAQNGDLFALDQIWLNAPCQSYLYREAVSGCPDANTMAVDLDMGGNDITGADEIRAGTIRLETLQARAPGAPITVEGAEKLVVSGKMDVTGDTELEDLTVLEASTFSKTVTIGDDLTVEGDLRVVGELAGGDLTFDGDLVVSGTARFGAARADEITARALTVERLSGGTWEQFGTLSANDVTVSTCTGCQ